MRICNEYKCDASGKIALATLILPDNGLMVLLGTWGTCLEPILADKQDRCYIKELSRREVPSA